MKGGSIGEGITQEVQVWRQFRNGVLLEGVVRVKRVENIPWHSLCVQHRDCDVCHRLLVARTARFDT